MTGNKVYACDSVYIGKIPKDYRQSSYQTDSLSFLPYCDGSIYSQEARMHLDLAAVLPSSLWDAKRAITNSNFRTLLTASPYSSVHCYPNGKIYFNVTDPAAYPVSFAPSLEDAKSKISEIVSGGAINVNVKKIKEYIEKINTMASWKDSKFLSEESKARAQAVVDRCKVFSETLDSYLKNEDKLSADSVNILLASLLKEIMAFDEEVAEINEELKEECKEAEAAKADELANRDGTGSSGSVGSASGDESSTLVVEGDSKMSNAQLANRYGLKSPAIFDISSVHINSVLSSASTKGKFEAEGLTVLDNKNAIAFLAALSDSQIETFVDTIDGQSFCDNDDEVSMKAFLDKFDGALDYIKSSGFMSVDDYNKAVKLLFDAKNAVKDSFTNSGRNTVVNNLKALKKLLMVSSSDGDSVLMGSQKHFDNLVKEKQKDASDKAIAELRKSYARSTQNSSTPLTYDESLTYSSLPEEVTYLPNKNVFKVKIESKTYLGKDFTELNQKIMRSKDKNIILSWIEIKKELLKVSERVVSPDPEEVIETPSPEDDDF